MVKKWLVVERKGRDYPALRDKERVDGHARQRTCLQQRAQFSAWLLVMVRAPHRSPRTQSGLLQIISSLLQLFTGIYFCQNETFTIGSH